MNRRSLLKAALALPIAAAAIGTYAIKIEPYWVEHVRLPMPIKNLPANLIGRTLVQISDMHIGDRVDQSFLTKALTEVKALNPDIVVYTGDFITHRSDAQFAQLQEILAHAPLGALGTAAILGNHDYGRNWLAPNSDIANTISTIVAGAGINILRNETASIAGLTVVGIDDKFGTNFLPSSALVKVKASGANVVLCHNPDVVDLPVWHGYRGWILSGHTHGGQVKLPFLPPPALPVENPLYSSGQFNLADGRTLYINRALGHAIPLRFNVRPEITIFTLQTA